MKIATLFVLAIFPALICPAMTSHPKDQRQKVDEPRFAGEWSETVNGMRARFKFLRNDSGNDPGKGPVRIEPYIELHNASNVLGNIDIAIYKSDIEYRLTNRNNEDVPQGITVYSGKVIDFGLVRVPLNSFLALNVTGIGAVFHKESTSSHIDLGPSDCWAFEKGYTDDCFLEAKIVVEGGGTEAWAGEISIPKSQVPLQHDGQ